ncbi:hypothetical protein ZWY2020_054471 [Hordeum vulgare]|nr:hypothetical protein ZWY2020_054471 [Hordeum vulgare]
MTVRSADVFHIYGLKNKGKDVIKHLATLEEGSKDYIPSRFLNEKTGTIVIDELIDHIVKSGSFDDDFVRRAVLVLIRTVIAPHSTKTVPRHLNSLVEDVDTIKLYNWNEFMLHVCIDGIAKKVKDQHKFKWPVGNLSLIQYSYWEKVQPTGIDEPLSYEYPLMLNWSEIKAKKHNEYDSESRRGHGKFDDVIGEDHREAKVAKEGTLPEVEAQTETSKRNGCASRVINIMKQIQKDVLTLPTKCAEIVIERLKKEGLIYKPSFNIYQSQRKRADESEVWVKRKYAPKYFPEVDSSPLDEHHQEEKNNASFTNMPIDEELNDDTGARINGSGIDTPNNPFIVNGNNSPVRSSSSLNYLDAEHIEAANAYINTFIENGKHSKDVVVKIPALDICTADMLGDNIKKKWLCGAVINAYCKQIKKRSKVPDRHILSTWVPKWLLDRAVGRVTGRKTKMELLVKRTTTITRVMHEYFSTDNAYFPMNVNGNYWITVLMHNTKKEFQVLDSLGPIDRNIRKTIHTVKAQIVIDIVAANKQVESKFPDVSAWPIVEYEMPKQTDGVSCGLFVLRCIEYWDGEKWTSIFDHDEINESRSKILVELIFSKDNIVKKVKHKVLRLISQD